MPPRLVTAIEASRCLACVGVVCGVAWAVATGTGKWYMTGVLLVALAGARVRPFIVVVRRSTHRGDDGPDYERASA